jgi:transposase-like protein
MPNVDRVEVLASIQRRRRYSLDQKLAVLAEAAQPGMSAFDPSRHLDMDMGAHTVATAFG